MGQGISNYNNDLFSQNILISAVEKLNKHRHLSVPFS